MSAIDRLLAASDNSLKRRTIELPNGEEFEFWLSPLTAAVRERAIRKVGGADTAEQLQKLGLELIVLRCCDETGAKLFMPTDVSRLKNELGTDLLDKLMGAVGSSDSEEEDDMATANPKSVAGATRKGAKG